MSSAKHRSVEKLFQMTFECHCTTHQATFGFKSQVLINITISIFQEQHLLHTATDREKLTGWPSEMDE